MKKAAIIFGLVIILLMGTIIAIPIIFKEPLLEKTKTTINKSINAKVEFSDFKLSLVRNFPKVTMELKNLIVSGVGQFANDTLLSTPSFRTKLSLMSLFSKEGIAIEELIITDPVLNLLVDSTGNANWDIMKVVEPESSPAPSSEKANSPDKKPFEIQLDKIVISNASIFYDDQSIPMFLSMKESEINLKGKMYGSSTELSGDAIIGKFLLNYDSVTYISNTIVKTNSVFKIDFEKWIIQIKESEWWVNKLPFDLAGDIKMPGDSILFNLDFKAKKSGFGDFLALVPPDYEKYLEGVETEGSVSMSGFFKGLYFDEEYPAFSFDFNIANGRINYTKLPEEIKNVSADVKIWKPQGNLDLMAVSVKNTHVEIGANPIDLNVELSNIYSNLNFDFALIGKFNFDELKKALPLDSLQISGKLDARISAKGNYNDVELKQYEKIKTDGKIVLTNFSYAGSNLTKPLNIPSGTLEFTPSDILLSEIKILAGESDLTLSGTISNYLAYFLKDGILKGDIRLKSNNLNMAELMALQTTGTDTSTVNQNITVTTSPQTQKNESPVFSIPENYDFKVSAEILKSKYEKLDLKNIKGIIAIKEGNINLNELSMDLPEGGVKMSGMYGTPHGKTPQFGINCSVRSLDIASVYNSLPAIGEIVPQAAKASGKFDGSMKLEGEQGKEIKINSMAGSATLSNFRYADTGLTKPIEILSGKIDFNSSDITLSQFKVIIGTSDMTLSGKVSNFLDYYNSKGTLEGGLQLKSDYLNFNELMKLQVEAPKQEAGQASPKPAGTGQPNESEVTAFSVPSNLNLTLTTNVAKALYDRMQITNINGQVTAKDGILNLQELKMNMLDGELKLNGSYKNTTDNHPDVDLGFAIVSFDVPSSYKSLKLFQQLVPVAEQSQGKFSTSFTMKGKLGPDMKTDFPTINGTGFFNTTNLQIVNSRIFDQLKGIIKKEKLNNIKIDDFTSNFTIENGNLLLKPFKTKVAGQETTISGNLNTQNLLDLSLGFNIQREAFGDDVQSLLNALPGQENIKLIPATVHITGPVNEPSVKVDLEDARKLIANEVKKSASESLKKLGNSLKKLIDQ